jgi:hypothetical protein
VTASVNPRLTELVVLKTVSIKILMRQSTLCNRFQKLFIFRDGRLKLFTFVNLFLEVGTL